MAKAEQARCTMGSGGSGIAQTAMTQGGLGLMMSTLMITAPMMVGNMIGTSLGGFSGFNMFSRTETPRDANGNVIGGNVRADQNNVSLNENSSGGNANPHSQNLMARQQMTNNTNTVKSTEETQRGAAV